MTRDVDCKLTEAANDATETMDTVSEITRLITYSINAIGDSSRACTGELKNLLSNPNKRVMAQGKHRILRRYARDVDESTDSIRGKTPILRKAWVRYEEAGSHFISKIGVENDTDLQAFLYLVEKMHELKREAASVVAVIQSFRSTQRTLLGYSRASDTALRKSLRALDDLIDVLVFGDSMIERLIDIANERTASL